MRGAWRRVLRPAALVAVLLSLAASPARAQLATVPVVTGLAGAVAFVQDPLLPATYYIVQREGLVRVLQNGRLRTTPFLDLRAAVLVGGERGLLGMAFAPDVATNRVFVDFTNVDGHTVVARFTRFTGQPRADAGTRLDLRWPDGRPFIEQSAANHNGGHLAFGPDGMLYIGLGDGGGGNDTYGNAQNPGTLLGKMLRIDVRVPDGDSKGYVVPPDNPFVGLPALGEIWAFGLRNPWRYSFDNPRLGGTGALVIGDVGQGAREEVDYEPRGAGGRNYGWPHREGRIATPGATPPPPVPIPFSEPLFDYPRDVGATVTGGYVYRGGALPAAFRGRYFVADYAGKVASVGLALDPATGQATVTDVVEHTATLGDIGAISSFAEDLDGELYLVSLDARRTVLKIVPAPGLVPGAPSGLAATVDGTSVTLAWSPGPGPAATAWRFTVGSHPDAADVLVTDLPATQTTVGTSGVAPGTYYVSVQGVNAAGAGPRSNEARVDVVCTPLPPPPGVRYSRAGPVVTLQWNAVSGAAGYLVTAITPPAGAVVATLGVGPVPVLTVAAPPGVYGVTVSAVGACGAGTPSSLLRVDGPSSGS